MKLYLEDPLKSAYFQLGLHMSFKTLINAQEDFLPDWKLSSSRMGEPRESEERRERCERLSS